MENAVITTQEVMQCLDVNRDMSGFEQVVNLQKTAFPPEECFSMEQILSLSQADPIMYKSFWRDDRLCGILFYHVGRTLVYLFYLAVSADQRSKGYGAILLQWLRKQYPDRAVVANIEPTGLGAENEIQRIRRYTFYDKNGFRRLDRQMLDRSGLYDIISTCDQIDYNEYMELIEGLGFGDYGPVLICAGIADGDPM